MSTDIFRRYLDLLNEADTGNPLQDLIKPRTDGGNYVDPKTGIIMYVPRKSPKAGSDAPDPDPKALDWKLLNQPEGQEIKNALKAAGLDIESVNKPSLFGSYPVAGVDPDKLAKALAGNAGPGQGGQPSVKEIPHIDPGELVAPNTSVALPSSGTFTNDMALANLANKIKDGSATTGGNVPPIVSKTTGGKNGEEDSGSMGGDTRCAKCGTKKMDHQGLNHAFVQPGSNNRPEGGGATPSVTPGGVVKRGGASTTPDGQGSTPDVSKVVTALTTIEKILDKYKTKLKENINRLSSTDQMKAWRTLMEYREVDEGNRNNRNRPTPPPAPSGPNPVISNMANQMRMFGPPEQTSTGGTVTQTPTGQTHRASPQSPNAPSFGQGTSMPTSPYQVPGSTNSPAGAPEASALSKLWKGAKKLGSKLALPATALVEIYEGYQQISALPTDMPRDQYRAKVTKIVARLVEDFGLFWVGSILGGAIAGVFSGGNPLGAVAGFVVGGTSGIAASYLLGDSVGAISDQIVDKLYGTGDSSSMTAEEKAIIMQNMAIIQDFVKANPNAMDADLKARIDRVLAAGKAAGVAPGQGGQPPPSSTVVSKPAAAATTPSAEKLNTTLDGIDKILKKYNFESQEFDSFFDSLTESEQRKFISKNLHLLSESEQMAERRDMLNEAGAWNMGKKGLRWLARKLYKAGGGASAGGTPVSPTGGTPWWKPGFFTGATVGVAGSIYGYFKIKEIVGGLLNTITDPATAEVITITPEDTAAWIQFNKELEAALPDQATYDALPQDVKDRLSMIAARCEAMDKAIKEARAKAK
jgi:hypothetical protein